MEGISVSGNPPLKQMSAAPKPPSKAGPIVVGVLVLIALIGWIVYLYISHKNQTGLFAPFTPTLAAGLVQPVPNSRYVPLTPEQIIKRDQLIQAALDKIQTMRTYGQV